MADLITKELPLAESRPAFDYAAWAVEHARQERQDVGRLTQCDSAQMHLDVCRQCAEPAFTILINRKINGNSLNTNTDLIAALARRLGRCGHHWSA